MESFSKKQGLKKSYAIGLMSGSSLDGVDLVYCSFAKNDTKWAYEILATACVGYEENMVDRLKAAPTSSALSIYKLDADLGHFFGEKINAFIQTTKIDQLDFIASHGHTIFHFPDQKYTAQIGDGAAIAAVTKKTVINQFRTVDVANGGQGAPIVPIGEQLLFSEYALFLNLGGIANISWQSGDKIIAFDVCVANQILNFLAQQKGKDFDESGQLAAIGKVDTALLEALNQANYFYQTPPKSLDNSFAANIHKPILEKSSISVEDKLATYCAHIVFQLQESLKEINNTESELFITGGGAFNTFLVNEIEKTTGLKSIIPSPDLVQYKEALIIAFMGYLRMYNQVNVLKSVSGASVDSINGAIYQG